MEARTIDESRAIRFGTGNRHGPSGQPTRRGAHRTADPPGARNLLLLAEGHTGPEIAKKLTIALNSAKWHTQRLYGKLRVHRKHQALVRTAELGLLAAAQSPPAATPQPRPDPQPGPPLQLTRFIGGEKEMAEVRGLLSQGRLVTLTSAGGSGKTRHDWGRCAPTRPHQVAKAWALTSSTPEHYVRQSSAAKSKQLLPLVLALFGRKTTTATCATLKQVGGDSSRTGVAGRPGGSPHRGANLSRATELFG